MATNVTIPEGFKIVNQVPKIPDGFKIVSTGSNLQPMTDEQKAQAREMAKQMRPEKTLGDKVSEFLVTNPIARQVGFVLQGIANAGLNPAGYAIWF